MTARRGLFFISVQLVLSDGPSSRSRDRLWGGTLVHRWEWSRCRIAKRGLHLKSPCLSFHISGWDERWKKWPVLVLFCDPYSIPILFFSPWSSHRLRRLRGFANFVQWDGCIAYGVSARRFASVSVRVDIVPSRNPREIISDRIISRAPLFGWREKK